MESVGSIESARRIHISGGPGSGKSTLARSLGEALDITVYELDKIAYDGPDFSERPLPDRLADVRAIADRPEWISEGIHLGWSDVLLQRADVVVWLDYTSWSAAAVRIVRRFTASAVAEVRTQPAAKKLTRFGDYRRHLGQLVYVLRSSRDYYKPERASGGDAVTREMAEIEFRPHATKVVRCRSRDDVRDVLARLTGSATPSG